MVDAPLELTRMVAPIALLFGVYLLVAGTVFNRLFGARLARLIEGAGRRPLGGGALSRAYGLHLLLLVLLAYVALLFAAVLVIDFGWFAADALLHLRRVPKYLAVALGAVVLVSLWGILRGLFGSPPTGNYGVEVGALDEPGLWRLSLEAAVAVGTRPADAIVVSPLSGVSVHEEGGLMRLLLGRTRRVLTVGAPSILGLTVQQYLALLGHEYGHFSNRDTTWGSLAYRAGSAVSQTLDTMGSTGARGDWYALLAAVNPARWTLWLYRLLFAYVTSGFSRMREVFADQVAIERYGAEPFKAGLRAVVVDDRLFGGSMLPRLTALIREGKYYTNLYATADRERRSLEVEEVERVFAEAAAGPPSTLDSHPSLRDRMAYAGRFAPVEAPLPAPEGEEPVVGVFADWRSRSVALTEMLTRTLLQATGARPVPPRLTDT